MKQEYLKINNAIHTRAATKFLRFFSIINQCLAREFQGHATNYDKNISYHDGYL